MYIFSAVKKTLGTNYRSGITIIKCPMKHTRGNLVLSIKYSLDHPDERGVLY